MTATFPLRILGIDPGPTESGWCVYRDGQVQAAGTERNEDLISAGVVLPDTIDLVAIEMMQSMGMAIGESVLRTVLWTGRFVQHFDLLELPVRLIHRTDIKLHLCHSARAKDPNVRQRLLYLLGPVGTKKAPGPLYGVKGHAWAALAVAVYAEENPIPMVSHEVSVMGRSA